MVVFQATPPHPAKIKHMRHARHMAYAYAFEVAKTLPSCGAHPHMDRIKQRRHT